MKWHGHDFRGFLNKAREVLFDKTGTTLQSDNVQDAIVELNSDLTDLVQRTQLSYYTVYPNTSDRFGNVEFSIPFLNPNKITPTIIGVYANNSDNTQADLTAAFSVINVNTSVTTISAGFSQYHVQKMVQISLGGVS